MDDLWVEKYRPHILDDVVGNEDVIHLLKCYVQQGYIQHLFFAGPPGSGKTTAAECLCNELHAEKLELNASDARGIEVIRGMVKEFAESPGFEFGKLRIIILDEVDYMTDEAQAALRRTMEKYSKRCRFILCCNYPYKVRPALKESRCIWIPFKRIQPTDIQKRLQYITEQEHMSNVEEQVQHISTLGNGDVRAAINMLQVLSVDPQVDLQSMFGTLKVAKVYKFIQSASQGQFKQTALIIQDMDENTFKAYARDIAEYASNLPAKREQTANALVCIGESIHYINTGAGTYTTGQYLAAGLYNAYEGQDVIGAILKAKVDKAKVKVTA
jgi:replication factor C small subunit